MTTSDDQTQSFVWHCVVIRRGLQVAFIEWGKLGEQRLRAGALTNAVDRPVPCGAVEPSDRVVRRRLGPVDHRCRKRLLQRFFGEVEVAEGTNQRREQVTPLRAAQAIE